MRKVKIAVSVLLAALIVLACLPVCSGAEEIKLVTTQDKFGEAKKFKALIDYFDKKGITVSFEAARDYISAADMFSKGHVDGMFCGSGVAGIMIIKGLADPVVRPVSKDGTSTYWASIIAKKGSPKFTGTADYFKGKKVILTGLASSGEIYFRSLKGADKAGAEVLKASSHGAAIDALNNGVADVAIVKNRVWDAEKGKYPTLELVGQDKGENPDGTLIVSKKMKPELEKKISSILLGLKDDTSAEADAVKSSLGIQHYIVTKKEDFKHTLGLLDKAGVKADFNFKF